MKREQIEAECGWLGKITCIGTIGAYTIFGVYTTEDEYRYGAYYGTTEIKHLYPTLDQALLAVMSYKYDKTVIAGETVARIWRIE